jgi:hypothetical protein
LGGTLQIDASNLEGLAPGERIPVLFADSITGEFDEVETIGGDGIQLVAGYGAESLDVGEVAKGDLNADGASFTDEDLELFTLALMVDRSTFVETVHSSCPGCLWMGLTEALGGDFTHDDVVDFSDIPKFMECYNKKGMCVLEGSPAEVDIYFPAVPEPSPGILAMVGVLCAVLAPRGSTCRVKFR